MTLPDEAMEKLEGWVMWSTGDGNFQRVCRTKDDVQVFIEEAIFGEVHTRDDVHWPEMVAYFDNFNDPENWQDNRWNMNFEDGGIHALRLDLSTLASSERKDAVLVPREATWDMIQAMNRRMYEGADILNKHGIEFALWGEVYRAMLDAAMKGPTDDK